MEAAEETAAIREALMATRIPVLIMGVLWSGMGLLSTLAASVNLLVLLPVGRGWMILLGALNLATNLAFLVAGGLLVLSGVAGIRAREDPKHIPSIAKHQANFWRIMAAVVLIACVGFLIVSLAL